MKVKMDVIPRALVIMLILSLAFNPFLPVTGFQIDEPHNADAMWIEPSAINFNVGTTSVGFRFNITVAMNFTEDVYAWQVVMYYNATQLKCTRVGVTAPPTSDFMKGHTTIFFSAINRSLNPPVNGSLESVLAFESCLGTVDIIPGPHSGTLFWAEFQILLAPTAGQTFNSKFDISTEYALMNTVVVDQYLSLYTFTPYDGTYQFTWESPSSTSVVCSSNPVSAGLPVTCTASVSGSSPTGTVIWSSNGTGSFSASNCTLASGSCSTTYTCNSTGGPVSITASYSGDSNNTPSSGTFILFIIHSAFDSTLRLDSGSGTFSPISASQQTIIVTAGETLNGTITLDADNSWPSYATVPLIGTPSWGNGSIDWWLINSSLPQNSSTQLTSVSLSAPLVGGSYYLIFAFRAESSGDQVASATNSSLGYDIWNDGNDIAEFNATQISQAQQNGVAVNDWLFTGGYEPAYVPASAIEIVVAVPTPIGVNVTVTPAANANVTFANVTAAGFTCISETQPPTDQFVSVVCDDIDTNATYTGNVTIQMGYDPSGLSLEDQQAMKIWLWNDSANCWIDITTFVNTTSHIVYGLSPHLSMFGVTSDLGIAGDLNVSGITTVSIPISPPPVPMGLSPLNYYQINTTKNLQAPINLSLGYNYGNVPPGEEVFTQMWMWNDTSASWVDITTSVNTTSHMVYGSAPHLSMFGVTSLPQPTNGITVTSANCPKRVVCQGYGANVSFTILNQGDLPQTNFDVTVFCNATLFATYHIDQLNPLGQIILNFTWNTAGWAKGNYSVSTCGASVGWITVSMIGDLTGLVPGVPDSKVDIRDIALVAKSFGSTPGTLGWNANCDVNNDGKADIRDIAIVAKHFGEADP